MEVPSTRRSVIVETFISVRSLDRKIITARAGVAHVDIVYTPISEQLLQLRLDDSAVNVFLGDEPSAGTISIECQLVGQHVGWKAAVLGISRTRLLVNEDRTRKGHNLLPVKRVVRKKYPTVSPDCESPKTLAARAVSRRHLGVGGMAVTW
jgi:hypothetical protein